MTMYKRHTLGELINALRALPAGARVNGLDPDIHSYRGYYERNAVTPAWDFETDAHGLADTYAKQIGEPIHGWNGGDYSISDSELIYLASPGDTGPAIIGLEADTASGVYEPVLLADDYHF
jgi:hypothetical protein